MISRRALTLAVFAVIAGAIAWGFEVWSRPEAAAYSYLAAFGWVFSSVLGALSMQAIGRAIAVRWFAVLGALNGALTSVTVVLPLFFLPLALLLPKLYPWAQAARVAEHPELHRAQLFGHTWFGAGWFFVRAAIYLALWLGLAESMRRAERDEARALRTSWFTRNKAALGAVGLPLLGFSGSWAGFDWLMSAVPGWNMTSVGLYLLTGGFASALGLFAIVVHSARQRKLLPKEVDGAHAHALGRMLFSAVCLWAYIAVSQLIIVWIANEPREAAFYLPRGEGAFRYLAGVLIFGHFVVPFFLLLSRPWKEKWRFVAGLGAWLALMHALDLYWLVVPSAGRGVSLLDAGPFLLLGGLSVVVAHARSERVAVVPARDPDLARSLAYESP